ncbi:hypothetical protein [Plantibacter sp. CFBP 13570]|uniref:hypothetical protein n=1 Tax=Plantibacter sp. CFBP 13570 TaxID=2775272 RepID=UPI001930B888|nr:hypothetical protein [Plantibacter sp. CFBP 13570]MBD8535654.1 hypothetical protein [Plantibacter sp. CFBP 13570]
MQDVLESATFWGVLGGTLVALLALGFLLDPRYRRRRRGNRPTRRRAAHGR